MKEKIVKNLKLLEEKEQIKILFACETGSRAWGFASPDSDYDIRFIYMHQKDWYLGLTESKDSIELMLDDGELDITGWDLRKTLRLLNKSNMSVFERIQSPFVYLSNDLFVNELSEVAGMFFSPVAAMHHYLSMAKGFTEKCQITDNVKLKNYFYALRATLSCSWIGEKRTMPPIEFSKMLYLLNQEQYLKVIEMLALKVKMNEKYHHPKQQLINNFLEETIKKCSKIANDLPSAQKDSKVLDAFFVKMLNN